MQFLTEKVAGRRKPTHTTKRISHCGNLLSPNFGMKGIEIRPPHGSKEGKLLGRVGVRMFS